MTDKLAAVACLADFDDSAGEFPERSEAIAKFYEDANGDFLVLNKWFGIQVRGSYARVGAVVPQGERRTHFLLALVIGPLTTHPFRDGAPLLLLIETPRTFGGGGVIVSYMAAVRGIIDRRIPTMPARSTSCFSPTRQPCYGRRGSVFGLSVIGCYARVTALLRYGGGCTHFMHSRSRVSIDRRVPAMPGRRTPGFHRPGRHRVHETRSAVRCSTSRMKGELHPAKNHL